MVSKMVRRYIPLAIVVIVVVLFTINYFTGEFSAEVSKARNYSVVATNFAVLLATATFLIRSVASIRENVRKSDWKWVGLYAYSLVIFAVFLGVYLLKGMEVDYTWLTTSIMSPSYATSWALTAFYLVAAVFKGWRIRNLDTAALVITALITSLAQAPAIAAMIPTTALLGDWLVEVPAMAGYRVFTITSGLAATSILIRTLRGRTEGYE